MPQRLTLYHDGEHAAWLDETGALRRGDLDAAAKAGGQREVVLLIPAEALLITAVSLPPIRQAGRRVQAARYALEDQLATRVDNLHFALAAQPTAGDQTAVAVIEREWLRSVLDACDRAGLNIVQVQPDALSLPRPPAGRWQVAAIDDRMLTRTARGHAFASELSLWPALAAGCTPPDIIALQTHTQHAADVVLQAGLEPAPEIEHDQFDSADGVLARLLRDADTHSPINLRQGDFARQSAIQTWWQPFKLTAGLAAAWLVLALAARGVESWQLNHRIDQLRAISEAAFRDAFPDVRTINDLRVQAEQNIRQLRGGGASGGIFSLLQATAEVTAKAGGIRIESLQYRDGSVQLSLNGDNVQALEALRAGFARQPTARLSVQSAQAGNNGVQIRASVRSANT